MFLKSTVTALFFASALVLPRPVYAGGDFIKGVAVGAGAVIIGKHILDKRKKKKARKAAKRKAYSSQTARNSVSSEQLASDQAALAELGYYTMRIDGKSGPGTRRAIRGFQSDNGYPETGRLTGEQRNLLFQLANVDNVGGDFGDDDPLFASTDSESAGEVDIFGNSSENEFGSAEAAGEDSDIFGDDGTLESEDSFALESDDPFAEDNGLDDDSSIEKSDSFGEVEVVNAPKKGQDSPLLEEDDLADIFEDEETAENIN